MMVKKQKSFGLLGASNSAKGGDSFPETDNISFLLSHNGRSGSPSNISFVAFG